MTSGDRSLRLTRSGLLDRLTEVGVDFDDVLVVLETEGVDKFKKSWDELVETVRGQMEPRRRPTTDPA